MQNKTQTEKEKLENEAINWENMFYSIHGCMPRHEDTPEKYLKVLWSEY